MDQKELKELIQGIVVTAPTPFDDDLKLDLARTTEVVRWWVEQSLGKKGAPLKMAAAGGEGPDMTRDEWEQLLRTTVNAAGPDAVIMAAIQPKSTYHSIGDAKRGQDLGIIGLQVDLPFFHHSNQDDYVRYFTDLSDAIDIGIMIYNTFWFGAPSITPETLARLKDTEHVVAVKWAAPSDEEFDRMKEFSLDFNVTNNSIKYIHCHKLAGKGNISATAHANAEHDFKFWQLLEDHRYDEAEEYISEFLNTVWIPCSEASGAKSGGYIGCSRRSCTPSASPWDSPGCRRCQSRNTRSTT